jgi:hypothetical protein
MVDFSILQDVDLDSIHSTQYEKLLDMAEYRCLEKVLNNCVDVDQSVAGFPIRSTSSAWVSKSDWRKSSPTSKQLTGWEWPN